MCLLPWLWPSALAKTHRSLTYISVWLALTTNVKLLVYHKENQAGHALFWIWFFRHHLTTDLCCSVSMPRSYASRDPTRGRSPPEYPTIVSHCHISYCATKKNTTPPHRTISLINVDHVVRWYSGSAHWKSINQNWQQEGRSVHGWWINSPVPSYDLSCGDLVAPVSVGSFPVAKPAQPVNNWMLRTPKKKHWSWYDLKGHT